MKFKHFQLSILHVKQCIQGGPKSKPVTDLSLNLILKPTYKATFFIKFVCKKAL